MIANYPLYWPDDQPRTKYPHDSRFSTTFAKARDWLIAEVDRLGACNLILSTNIPLRQDGLPYANAKEPDDSGIAVYFTYNGDDMCFACDTYYRVWENTQAIAKTIEALRGIERWGASDMMERAFRGFQSLPDQSSQHWRDILDCHGVMIFEDVRLRYKILAQEHHPDKGGDPEQFKRINKALEQAREEMRI